MNPEENQPPSEQNVPHTPASGMNEVTAFTPPSPSVQAAPPFAPQPVALAQSQPSGSKGLAIASLVLGIIGFLTGFLGIGILLGLVAVVLAIIALAKHHAGKGLAIAGLILGAIAVVVGGFLFLMISLASLNGIQQHALDKLCSTTPSDSRCTN